MSDVPPPLLEMIGNLSEFHREHEKFYAQRPLRQALEVEAASRTLKALADRWSSVSPRSGLLAVRSPEPVTRRRKDRKRFVGGREAEAWRELMRGG